jgi:hypothetical protein
MHEFVVRIETDFGHGRLSPDAGGIKSSRDALCRLYENAAAADRPWQSDQQSLRGYRGDEGVVPAGCTADTCRFLRGCSFGWLDQDLGSIVTKVTP